MTLGSVRRRRLRHRAPVVLEAAGSVTRCAHAGQRRQLAGFQGQPAHCVTCDLCVTSDLEQVACDCECLSGGVAREAMRQVFKRFGLSCKSTQCECSSSSSSSSASRQAAMKCGRNLRAIARAPRAQTFSSSRSYGPAAFQRGSAGRFASGLCSRSCGPAACLRGSAGRFASGLWIRFLRRSPL